MAMPLARCEELRVNAGRWSIHLSADCERFSSTLVNGAAVPSPMRPGVAPLDLFLTNILESVMVQKTYSPDRPAEFAGGNDEMRTRGIPDAFSSI